MSKHSKMHVDKKVAQLELRRLMNMQKLKSGEAPKKIESPLACYTPLGVLKCNVCRVEVGGEALWPRHIASKEHLKQVNLRKPVGKKRLEVVEKDDVNHFREKVSKRKGLEMPHQLPMPTASPPPKKLKGILKNAPVPSQNLDVSETTVATSPTEISDLDIIALKTSLHDAMPLPKAIEVNDPTVKLTSRNGDTSKSSAQQGDILPKGFFDDPELDAKARNIEYKNPVEEEWAKFQKEIKEQTDVSAQIIADDQDVATAERQIDEIDEQMRNWGRVMDLEQKVEEARKHVKTEYDGSSSPDEMDFDEFPDWRRKKAYTH